MEDDGFDTWYAAAWPRVLRAVTTYLADPGDAADLAADACARTLLRARAAQVDVLVFARVVDTHRAPI